MKWLWTTLLVLSVLGVGACLYSIFPMAFVADSVAHGTAMHEWSLAWLSVFEALLGVCLLTFTWATIHLVRGRKRIREVEEIEQAGPAIRS